ncbi:MAG TPA: hypothetical protein VGD31_11360, partial [Sphingobacteriaceae bacterium]
IEECYKRLLYEIMMRGLFHLQPGWESNEGAPKCPFCGKPKYAEGCGSEFHQFERRSKTNGGSLY